MRKSLSVAIVLVTAFSMISMLAPRAISMSSKSSLEVELSPGTIWQDDFENYTVGSFPSPQWSLWTSGMGTAEQRIVDTVSVSGSKSFRMYGSHGWAAIAARSITVTANMKFGFEVMVLVENYGTPPNTGAIVGFASSKPSVALWRQWGLVNFHADRNITAAGVKLASYSVNTWYKVKEVFDAATKTFSVWINDELKAASLVEDNAYPATDIEALALVSNWAEQVNYFDDVMMFEVQASISLTPNTGFAATTVVGSGFSNDSEVTMAWDGTVIPTVPIRVMTDATGSFATIISVPTQTAPGVHTVNATDESGNWATATFTVVNMTGPQGPAGLQGSQGPKGDKGDKGDTGLQGPTGLQGQKGDKGDKGDTGSQGPPGENQLVFIAFPTAASIFALCIAVVALLRRKT